MAYSVEIRSDTVKTKQMLNVTEMNTLHKITRKTRRDRVRIEERIANCQLQPIEE
mgnify:CR=1 FL=1